MRAIWNGKVIAESDDTIVIEGNHYFPPDSLKDEYFTRSSKTSVCFWKGRASYLDIEVDGSTHSIEALPPSGQVTMIGWSSGDIYIVFEPNRFINDFDSLVVASTHGSPWRYDSHVPIVFAGDGLKAQAVDRKVFTVDVATTLAAYMDTKPPSGAAGVVLEEVLTK